MNFSDRNKKAAISRWNKIHNLENKNINNDLVKKAAICGFLAGDGSVQIRKEKNKFHYQLDFFPDDILMRDIYLKYILDVFGKTPSITQRDNVFHVRLASKVVVCDLWNSASFGIDKWTIPNFVNADKLMISWLKAFFSAEAYIGDNTIRVQTINQKGMMQVQNLLKNLDIQSKYYEYTPRIKNCAKVYIIVIARKSSRKKYFKKIGFFHEKKTLALKKTLGL